MTTKRLFDESKIYNSVFSSFIGISDDTKKHFIRKILIHNVFDGKLGVAQDSKGSKS